MIRGIVIEEGGEEERLGHVIGHVVGEQRVLDTGDEALAEDDVRGLDVAHPHQRQGPVEVVHLGGVLRAQAAVLPQRGGLEVGALPRHGPRIPHAAHVRERLLDDDGAGLGLHDVDEVEVAVADLLDLDGV